MRRFMSLLAVILVIPALVGCYRYSTVDFDSVAPGDVVQVRVTPEAMDRLPASFQNGEVMKGAVVQLTDDQLVLNRHLPSIPGRYERISLAHHEVADLEVRDLDRTRTGLLVAGTAAVGIPAVSGIAGGAWGALGEVGEGAAELFGGLR